MRKLLLTAIFLFAIVAGYAQEANNVEKTVNDIVKKYISLISVVLLFAACQTGGSDGISMLCHCPLPVRSIQSSNNYDKLSQYTKKMRLATHVGNLILTT